MPTHSTTRRPTRAKGRKDPRGGLTAAGRAYFREKEGAHLRPGVKGPVDTPEKMRRKGSFLRRHFARPRGPLRDEQGRPTRLALSAQAWGEPVPRDAAAARRLAVKGTRLLDRYHATKKRAAATARKQAASPEQAPARKRATPRKTATTHGPTVSRKPSTRSKSRSRPAVAARKGRSPGARVTKRKKASSRATSARR